MGTPSLYTNACCLRVSSEDQHQTKNLVMVIQRITEEVDGLRTHKVGHALSALCTLQSMSGRQRQQKRKRKRCILMIFADVVLHLPAKPTNVACQRTGSDSR